MNEVFQILQCVVEHYAKNDRTFGFHCGSFDDPNLQLLHNYNMFFATAICLVILNVIHHYNLVFLIDNLLYVGVNEIIGFKKLVANLDKMTIPNLSRQHSKSSNSYFKGFFYNICICFEV